MTKQKNTLTINAAAKKIGVRRSAVQEWVDEGRVEAPDGMIPLKKVISIKKEIESYISLERYLKTKNNGLFDSRYIKNREQYWYYVEDNNFFGIKFIHADDFPFPYENGDTYYFEAKNIDKLDNVSEKFFREFGLSEQEKCKIIINECKYKETKRLLSQYVEFIESFTKSTTEFVEKASRINICDIKEEEIAKKMNEMSFEASKNLMISFLEFGKKSLNLKWGRINRKPHKTKKEIGAYPYKTYVKIAKALFNEEEIIKNHVLEKSFDKSKNYETWLYLSIHFVCGWRSPNICQNWPHPSDSTLKELNINLNTIKEDVLDGKIDDNTYYELGSYIEKSIELAAVKNHKTKKGSDLLAPIGPELKYFFGRLVLIGEYHRNKTNEGFLKVGRTGDYLNHKQFKNLFGDSLYKVMRNKNLASKRLNKSYLQSIEAAARKNGAGPMAAYTLATYARNHSNVDTAAIYIYDHGIDGETAEVVLALMLDRGIFGTILYHEFLAAFPNSFENLTAREQTQILAECEMSSYELEIMGTEMIAEETLKKSFAEGDVKNSIKILRAMFEITQGFGKAKDKGIFCKKRALGEACESPLFESCLANVCPYLIFSQAGIKSLIYVVKAYRNKAIETGNPKYEEILKTVIIPAYKVVLTEVSEHMNTAEKDALKIAIGEYNGEYTTTN